MHYNDRIKSTIEDSLIKQRNSRILFSRNVHGEKSVLVTGCFGYFHVRQSKRLDCFQKSIFMYAEDTDYCCRILQAGYIMLYCDECTIYHKISASKWSE